MPPLGVHTRIARDAAELLRLPALDTERGNLYLGSTAPDIRVLTRWERSRTHYFDIHNFDEQASVQAFLEANPALADSGALDPRTLSFIAGYLSHLVTDETWIGAIYRPYFGERSPLGGTLRANVMDRALQFSMDASARSNEDLMLHVTDAVARCDLDLSIDFIDRDTLDRWHEVISDFVRQQPDWERFRERSRRHLEESGQTMTDEWEDLAKSLPELVDETLRYLNSQRVDDALQESLDSSVRVIKEYVGCA